MHILNTRDCRSNVTNALSAGRVILRTANPCSRNSEIRELADQ